MMFYPARGEIWLVDLDPTRGHEQAKKRPCLILSTNTFNTGPSGLVVVAPLTSKSRNNPLHIPICPDEGGVKTPSYILADQIRTVTTERLSGKALGRVYPDTIDKVIYRIKALLEIP